MPRKTPKTKAGKKKKVDKVMHEWKAGTLKSSTGGKVTKQSQAIAIAMSEAGIKPKKKKKAK